MAEHMRIMLVNDALSMAIWQRKPEKCLLWHSEAITAVNMRRKVITRC